MIELLCNDESSTVFRSSCEDKILVRADYSCHRPKVVTDIIVMVRSFCRAKAKNPITVIRMILMLLNEFERRGIERVEFVSLKQYNELHEHFIRSFGWTIKHQSMNTETGSRFYVCVKG